MYDTKTRITIGATAHLMMFVDGNNLGSLLNTVTRTRTKKKRRTAKPGLFGSQRKYSFGLTRAPRLLLRSLPERDRRGEGPPSQQRFARRDRMRRVNIEYVYVHTLIYIYIDRLAGVCTRLSSNK